MGQPRCPRQDPGLWVCVAMASLSGALAVGLTRLSVVLARLGLVSMRESRAGLVGRVPPGAPLGTSPRVSQHLGVDQELIMLCADEFLFRNSPGSPVNCSGREASV